MANKLELTWYGKENEIKVEPRILIENTELSSKKADIKGQATLFDLDKKEIFDNMLIHGDNLLALKALEKEYAGKIKCIYIDPPYNTGAAFEHYDDNVEHSTWLSLMKPRLELLRNLLSEDGTIWISIDSYESHYLKVLCDEIFGRKNFIDEVIWQRAYAPVNLKKTLSKSHDAILVYAKNFHDRFELNRLPRTGAADNRYKNPDNDPRGVWKSSDCTVGPVVESKLYEIITPSGRSVYPPAGRCWLYTKERFEEMKNDNRIWFGPNGDSVPSVKKFLTEVKDGIVAQTLWTYDEVGHNQDAKKEIKALNFETVFATPKPEKLIERILILATNEGDLILDSFLGSGTTVAVAHKMGRKWIGIEMGEHAYTHCKVRMDKVIDGEQGGISKSRDWQGGGGYKFYELAPTLIKEDAFGQEIINPEYNAEMLASAIAKHEGYTYQPDETVFWKQSHNGKSFLFVTTNHVNSQMIETIKADLQEDEFVLIVCKSFESGCNYEKNIAIKKIPQSLLKNCEFGRDDYSLNIICPPEYEEDCDE